MEGYLAHKWDLEGTYPLVIPTNPVLPPLLKEVGELSVHPPETMPSH